MIFVDADSCPVKDIIINLGKKYNKKIKMYFDPSHQYSSDYAIVKIVEKERDSVDLYIANEIKRNDILITDDYGLASLAIAKQAIVLSSKGLKLDSDNIDFYLNNRYLGVVARKANKHLSGPKKRTNQDDEMFTKALIDILEENDES